MLGTGQGDTRPSKKLSANMPETRGDYPFPEVSRVAYGCRPSGETAVAHAAE